MYLRTKGFTFWATRGEYLLYGFNVVLEYGKDYIDYGGFRMNAFFRVRSFDRIGKDLDRR